MNSDRPVLVVGSGPAGIFCARETAKAGLPTMLVERGKPLSGRACPGTERCECRQCSVLEGQGGAGGWSDGKLTLTGSRGVYNTDREVSPEEPNAIEEVAREMQKYAPPGAIRLVKPLLPNGYVHPPLYAETYDLLHVGSDGVQAWARGATEELEGLGVRVLFSTSLDRLTFDDWDARKIFLAHMTKGGVRGWTQTPSTVVLATGLSGYGWLKTWHAQRGVGLQDRLGDIGVRLECPAEILEPLIKAFYDVKIHYDPNDNLHLRTFCTNQGGVVCNENHREIGITGVNGYAYSDHASGFSNMAILMSLKLLGATDDWVLSAARHMNQEGKGGTLAQSVNNFLTGRGSRWSYATHSGTNSKAHLGRIDLAMPEFLGTNLKDFLVLLDCDCEGIIDHGLLYAPEIKYFQKQVPVDVNFRHTAFDNLYIPGNASGSSASFISAAVAGMLAGRDIVKRQQEVVSE
jgi:uncharacterized protein